MSWVAPIAEIGIAFYRGDGTRGLIRNTRSTNGEIRPWTDYPTNGRTRSIRIVRDRSSVLTVHTAATSSSLTEAKDISCSAWRPERLSRKRRTDSTWRIKLSCRRCRQSGKSRPRLCENRFSHSLDPLRAPANDRYPASKIARYDAVGSISSMRLPNGSST
jgi:hypothetical protein